MTRRAHEPTGGARTGSAESAMTSSGCALRWRLWNERDPILKERLFGLTNSEANHGEDVKEYYFYIDSTPTHSYMKYLYKYPQREYPYRDLIDTNRGRSRKEFEYELLDTGVFDDDRYFDVFVEYAKEGPEDILVRITVHNRGPEAARLRVLPTLWFRNTWSWDDDRAKPSLREAGPGVIQATHHELGEYWLHVRWSRRSCSSPRTRAMPAVSGASPTLRPTSRMRSTRTSSRAAARRSIPPRSGPRPRPTMCSTCPPAEAGPSACVWRQPGLPMPLAASRQYSHSRIADADEFYDRISPPSLNEDERRVHRQALAGMLWSKQYYYYDLDQWLQRAQESSADGIHAGTACGTPNGFTC